MSSITCLCHLILSHFILISTCDSACQLPIFGSLCPYKTECQARTLSIFHNNLESGSGTTSSDPDPTALIVSYVPVPQVMVESLCTERSLSEGNYFNITTTYCTQESTLLYLFLFYKLHEYIIYGNEIVSSVDNTIHPVPHYWECMHCINHALFRH